VRYLPLHRHPWLFVSIVGLGAVLFVVLGRGPRSDAADSGAMMSMTPAAVTKAVCVVRPLGDNKVSGTVTFTKTADGVDVSAELTGLPPGEHGFHVHEFGDCSKMDGVCAGGHYNPTGMPHAGPDSPQRHEGDLGNITADSSGNASYHRVDKMLKLDGPYSIIGRAIIVHAGRDDLKTQPSGDAGARIGCGTIGIADPNAAM
jgi:superoxide dismutase, Cu-Zn family